MASWKEALAIDEKFEKFVMHDLLAKTGFMSKKNDVTTKYKYYEKALLF